MKTNRDTFESGDILFVAARGPGINLKTLPTILPYGAYFTDLMAAKSRHRARCAVH
jgi:hypothetical protein